MSGMRTLLLTVVLALTCSVATAAKPMRDVHDIYRGASMRLRQEITPKTRTTAQAKLVFSAGRIAKTLTHQGAVATLATVRELAPNHPQTPRVTSLLEQRIAATGK